MTLAATRKLDPIRDIVIFSGDRDFRNVLHYLNSKHSINIQSLLIEESNKSLDGKYVQTLVAGQSVSQCISIQ